jgi:hypothetical protein
MTKLTAIVQETSRLVDQHDIEYRTSSERCSETLTARPRKPDEAPRRTPVGQPDRRSKLNHFDRSLLKFVIQWRPYGGPRDEDSLPLFGIRARDLPQRVQTIASEWRPREMNLRDRVQIVRALAAVQTPLPPENLHRGAPRAE